MMTRKDYVAIAKAIASVRDPNDNLDEVVTASLIAEKIANVCAADNPRFDRERFIAACSA